MRGENGDRSPSASGDRPGQRWWSHGGCGKREGEVRQPERVREVGRTEEGMETGERSTDMGPKRGQRRKRERDRTKVRGDAEEMRQEQPRASGSGPGPVPALLASVLPICETGMGTHAPLCPPPLLVGR